MKYLLDTHTFIWFSENDPQLSKENVSIIEDPANNVYLSVGSLWEIAIKVSLDKLHIHQSLDKIIEEVQDSGIVLLSILYYKLNNFHFFIAILLTG